MITEVVGKSRGMPDALAARRVAEVVETIVRESVAEAQTADAVRARDYRRFIIETLTLEEKR